jgi:hypothetical protein
VVQVSHRERLARAASARPRPSRSARLSNPFRQLKAVSSFNGESLSKLTLLDSRHINFGASSRDGRLIRPASASCASRPQWEKPPRSGNTLKPAASARTFMNLTSKSNLDNICNDSQKNETAAHLKLPSQSSGMMDSTSGQPWVVRTRNATTRSVLDLHQVQELRKEIDFLARRISEQQHTLPTDLNAKSPPSQVPLHSRIDVVLISKKSYLVSCIQALHAASSCIRLANPIIPSRYMILSLSLGLFSYINTLAPFLQTHKRSFIQHSKSCPTPRARQRICTSLAQIHSR